jgi:protein SCO1/2
LSHGNQDRAPGALERFVSNLVGSRLFWLGFIALVVSLPIAKALTTKLPPAPPKLRQVPEFTLTDQDGRPFGSAQLAGRLWVANFIYTSCGSVCPRLTQAMAEVKHRARNLKGVVSLVSFTVDPEHDTPAVLNAYVEKNHARGDWSFLTGSLDNLRSLVTDGFRLGTGRHGGPVPLDEPEPSLQEVDTNAAAKLFEVAHGEQLLLVDKDRWVRGSYSPDTSGLNRLMHDMGYIANLEGYVVTNFDPAPASKRAVNSLPPSSR